MSSVLRSKEEGISVSEQERAELALSLIESLDGPSDPDVKQAWRKEIEPGSVKSNAEKSSLSR